MSEDKAILAEKRGLTVGGARGILSFIWVVGLLPLMLLIIMQIVSDRFQSGWTTPWGWFSTLVFPIWSLIFVVSTVSRNRYHSVKLHSTGFLWITILISVAYIMAMHIIAILGLSRPQGIDAVMEASSLYMGSFQAIVVALLGKIFIEDIIETK